MTPLLSIRTFSNDQFVLDKMFYSNFYRMRPFKENERRPVVVDMGAHCGYFTFTAISLGAKKVYAFEPFTPNYQVLLNNVANNPIGPVVPYQLGVYVAPACLTFYHPLLIDKSYFDFANVGMDMNTGSTEYCKCCVLPLDTLLESYIGEQVDLMKLSIGYAEIKILEYSSLLTSMVANLCGEILLDKPAEERFRALLASKGFTKTSFYPSQDNENKLLFLSSKTDLKEMFN